MRFDPDQILRKRAIMISGKEAAIRSRTLSQLLERLGTGPEDFDFEEVLGDTRSPAEWIASVGTIPFLSEFRTLIVRHVLRADVPSDASTLLKSIPETGRLVLVADEEATLDDDKVRRLGTLCTAWERAVTAAGGTVVKCDLESKTVATLLAEEAKLLGKRLSVPAANVLAEMSGGSFSRALDELQKLVVYVGDHDEIREADVLAVATPSREWNIFKLLDCVISGQTAGAMRQLSILVGSTSKADEAGNRSILPQMSRQFRLLWQARACLDAQTQPSNSGVGLERVLLEKPNLAAEADWLQRKAMDAARKATLGQLARCLSEVAEADAKLKGQLPSASAMETLEVLVLRCAAIMQEKRSAPSRR